MLADYGSTTLPGRAAQASDIAERLAYVSTFQRLNGRIRVDVGPRGIGKTSLLRAGEQTAKDSNFTTVFITAGGGSFLEAMSAEFTELGHRWQTSAKEQLQAAARSVTISLGPLSIKPGASPDDAPAARRSAGMALQRLIRAATQEAVREGSAGLALFVDEIQAADVDGLRALAYAWQHMQGEDKDLPATVFAAGLSHSQDVITAAASFAERFDYQHLGNLDDGAAITALTAPSARMGVSWAPDAARAALAVGENYPYFVQLIGHETWKAAGLPAPGSVLTTEHVTHATTRFHATQKDFFRARWMKATPAEAKMLAAMAQIGDADIRRKDIADLLGTRTEALSMPRRSLMDKGLIEDSDYGRLSFTAPGFASYIRDTIIGPDVEPGAMNALGPGTDTGESLDGLLRATQDPSATPGPSTPPNYRGPVDPVNESAREQGPER